MRQPSFVCRQLQPRQHAFSAHSAYALGPPCASKCSRGKGGLFQTLLHTIRVVMLA